MPTNDAFLRAATRSSFVPRRERRRRIADELYDQLLSGSCGFWEDIRPLLLAGMRRLFLNVMPRLSRNPQTVEGTALTPCSAISLSAISAAVRPWFINRMV